MSSPFVAEIRIFGFNFAPTGWALCNGQLLPISQNTALFSLLGTTYGGDGKSTFALPNLRGCVPISWGQGPGLSNYDPGQAGGTDVVSLLQSELPAHTHQARAASSSGNQPGPSGNVWAGAPGRTPPPRFQNGPPNSAMSASAIANAGGSQPHNNRQPYLGLNFCIALQGVFPPRS